MLRHAADRPPRTKPRCKLEPVVSGRPYDICLRFRRYYKPYAVKLIDFKHDKYTGTELPRNFSSDIQRINLSPKLVDLCLSEGYSLGKVSRHECKINRGKVRMSIHGDKQLQTIREYCQRIRIV